MSDLCILGGHRTPRRFWFFLLPWKAEKLQYRIGEDGTPGQSTNTILSESMGQAVHKNNGFGLVNC